MCLCNHGLSSRFELLNSITQGRSKVNHPHSQVELDLRQEDLPLIKGSSYYVDDLKIKGRPAVLYMAVVRSPYAHAIINSIDSSKAKNLPQVVAIFAGEELVKDM